MNNIWITSDTHFSHKNILKYCNRPFASIEEHDEKLIEYWNMNVQKNDVVYHLGDFCFGPADIHLKRLNGSIILIRGSHDDRTINQYGSLFKKVYDFGAEINYKGNVIVLCHYCMRVWAKSHYNTFHAYGHSHGKLEPIGKSWDVGIDNNSYRPVSLDEFITIMQNRPDNFNLVTQRRYE